MNTRKIQTLIILLSLSFCELLFARSSAKDSRKTIIKYGSMSDTQYVIGGVVGSTLGLGLGHAIQGRYTHGGLFFTVAEPLAIIGTLAALASSSLRSHGESDDDKKGDALVYVGLASILGLKIWESWDVWATSHKLKTKYRRMKKPKYSLTALPNISSDNRLKGSLLQLEFNF